MDMRLRAALNRWRETSRINLIMGYLNSFMSAAISFIAIRLYVSSLGIELFGVIAFYISTRTLLQILDLGMTQTICREVATHKASKKLNDVAALFFSMERIVLTVGFTIAVLFWLSGSAFVTLWFQGSAASVQALKNCMTGMGIAIASRWVAGFFQGVLVGAERLALSSILNVCMVVLSDLGVIVLWSLSIPSLETYFLWQAIVGIAFTGVVRWLSWRTIGPYETKTFSIPKIREIGGFSIDVAAISVSGLLLSQIDRIVVSKTLSLSEFAVYSLSTMVAGTVYLITNPVFSYIYPRFSRLIGGGEEHEVLKEYRATTRMLVRILFPSAAVIVMMAVPIVSIWLGEEEIAIRVSPLVALLIVGYTIHSTMYIPYSLLLASGKTRSTLLLYLGLVISFVPATIGLSRCMGTFGAALSQVLLFGVYFVFGSALTYRTVLHTFKLKWLIRDLAPSMISSLIIGAAGYYAMEHSSLPITAQFLLAGVVWIASYYFDRLLRKGIEAE
jgi:O-antigen/teichoic acid export membrane protein